MLESVERHRHHMHINLRLIPHLVILLQLSFQMINFANRTEGLNIFNLVNETNEYELQFLNFISKCHKTLQT